MSRLRPGKPAYLPFAAILLALAACQPAALMPAAISASETKFPHAERPVTAVGTVSIKVDGLNQAMADKSFQTKTQSDLSQVRQIRLTARGPEMTQVTSTQTWPLAAGATLNLNVPVGKNRLIIFEGLDGDGYPLITLRAAVANVTTDPQEVLLDANGDVAGRVLEQLIALQHTQANADTALAVDDLVPKLQSYVLRLTGYDQDANTYQFVPPRQVRSGLIVDRMMSSGWQVVQGLSIPQTLFMMAGANVSVTVTDPQGNPVSGATVNVLDPFSSSAVTGADGKATIGNVPPGNWTVRATSGTLTASNTVATKDQEATMPVLLSLRAPHDSSTPVSGQTLTDEIRLLINGTGDPQAEATQLTNLAERLMEQAPSEDVGVQRLHEAFAAAITSEADVQKLAEREQALDGWTLDSSLAEVDHFQTSGFRTAQAAPPQNAVCPTTTRPKLTLLYINDKTSTYLDFLETYAVLFKRLRGSQIVPDVKVLAHFNACDEAPATRKEQLCGLNGSGCQSWMNPGVWGARAGSFKLNGGGGGIALVESMMQPPAPAHLTTQKDRLCGLVETEIMSGNKVVLMPHGQGNHLAKACMEEVKTKADQGMYGPNSANVKDACGTISLGSPIDAKVDNFSTHQTSVAVDKDFVTVPPTINAHNSMVACSTPAAAVLANCAAEAGGRETVQSPCESDKALDHHDCTKSYLCKDEGAQPWQHVLTDLNDCSSHLNNPFVAAGSGWLQFQLRWQTMGDVDLYIKEPSDNVVYYGRKIGGFGALDVDNVISYGPENYYVCSPDQLRPGQEFNFGVNFYRNRGADPIPYSVWVKAGNTSKTYTGTVTGANFGCIIIGLGRVRIGQDARSGQITYDILDGAATIPSQVSLPVGFTCPSL